MAKYSTLATRFACSLLAALLLAPAALHADDDKELVNRVRSEEATKSYTSLNGATIWINPAKWTWVKSDNEDTLAFLYQTGFAQARLLVGNEPTSNDELLANLLKRLGKVDSEPEVLFQEPRRINGVDMLCVQIRVVNDDRNVVYYGVIRGDQAGSYEMFAVTWEELLGPYYDELTKVIEGLELPSATAQP